MSDVNADFGLGIGDEELDEVEAEVEAAPKKAKRKKAEKPEAVAAKPKKTKKLYTIMIDEVEGMPDFEIVGVNGVYTQLKRGVEIPGVKEEVLEVLRNATADRVFQVNAADGSKITKKQSYSSIPYRVLDIKEVEA